MPAGVAVDAPEGYVDMCRRSPAACSDDPAPAVEATGPLSSNRGAAPVADADTLQSPAIGVAAWPNAPTDPGFRATRISYQTETSATFPVA